MAVLAYLRTSWLSLTWFAPSERSVGAFEELVQRYSEPGRHYHTLDHIGEVVGVVGKLGPYREPRPIALAAFLHDVVYNPRATDNEERSAEFSRELLQSLGASSDDQEETARLILLTKRHETEPTDLTGCALLDADLFILSSEPEKYNKYAADIRREYAWVPEEQYRQGRRSVLEKFLARPRIFHTSSCSPREPLARTNLTREIASLS